VTGVLVDSNIILDIILDDPNWADWSETVLADAGQSSTLYINQIIYSEISIAFEKIEELESALRNVGFQLLEIPKEALFLAGKTYLRYRRGKEAKRSPLSHFYIGAQAAVLGMDLITRDEGKYRTYFPTVKILCPER
jgi:predicted nucleic acid-binding protein